MLWVFDSLILWYLFIFVINLEFSSYRCIVVHSIFYMCFSRMIYRCLQVGLMYLWFDQFCFRCDVSC